jgi:hypothetical protein
MVSGGEVMGNDAEKGAESGPDEKPAMFEV